MDRNKRVHIKVSKPVDIRYSLDDIDNYVKDLEDNIKLRQDEIEMWQQRRKLVERQLTPDGK